MPLKAQPADLPIIIYEKLQNDVSPEVIRNDLLDACAVAGAHGMAAAFAVHCDANALKGTVVSIPPAETLGHVKAEKRVASNIANELMMIPGEVESLFQGLAGEQTQTENDLANDWFEGQIVHGPGQNIHLAWRTAWLFRPSTPSEDPFACDLECLPWNLGLPMCALIPGNPPPASNVPCVGFRVPGSVVTNSKLPTIFDAGWEASIYYWYPGGKTMPHSHGPATCSGPIEEIVADAPYLREVRPQIVRFKSKPL